MSGRRKNSKRDQAMLDEGYAAAGLGKTVDDCPYQGPWSRNAWIIGWRNGGGNIMTGKSRRATHTTAETPDE
jgi:ribosome modulation factor